MPEILNQASMFLSISGPLIEPFRGDDSSFRHSRKFFIGNPEVFAFLWFKRLWTPDKTIQGDGRRVIESFRSDPRRHSEIFNRESMFLLFLWFLKPWTPA